LSDKGEDLKMVTISIRKGEVFMNVCVSFPKELRYQACGDNISLSKMMTQQLKEMYGCEK